MVVAEESWATPEAWKMRPFCVTPGSPCDIRLIATVELTAVAMGTAADNMAQAGRCMGKPRAS